MVCKYWNYWPICAIWAMRAICAIRENDTVQNDEQQTCNLLHIIVCHLKCKKRAILCAILLSNYLCSIVYNTLTNFALIANICQLIQLQHILHTFAHLHNIGTTLFADELTFYPLRVKFIVTLGLNLNLTKAINSYEGQGTQSLNCFCTWLVGGQAFFR